MTDNRFKDFPVDARFPSLGRDVRFEDFPTDKRFTGGLDTRFQGPAYGGGGEIPVITGVPTISGTATVGSVLTASPAPVTGDPTPTRTWQWYRGGVAIGGATSITYTLVLADSGATITVEQIETNTEGFDTAVSAGVAVAFTPASLFASSEPGAFYDISDRATTFTDTAGTIQAVVGDQVARVNDKSGRGNHVTQPTLANRPFLGRHPAGGRRNILVSTAAMSTQVSVTTAAQHTLSFRGTGTVTLTGTSTAGPLVGTGPTDIVSLTFTPTAGNLTLTVSGTVELAQLELGASRSAYQSVNDAAGLDVTESGQADVYFLRSDGNDVLSSGTSTQLVGPWEFWAKINYRAGAGINTALFAKTIADSAFATSQASEGIFQRSDGASRRILAHSRIDVGTNFTGTADSSFVLGSPFTAKAIAATGPDSLTAITPLASGAATTPDFTGTPFGSTAFRIGAVNLGAQVDFYAALAIDRNLTAGEATDLDAWMDALLNP